MTLNALNQDRSYYFDVSMPFERDLPFVPLGVIPYSAVFATIVLGFHSIPVERYAYFRRGAFLFFMMLNISFVIFALFPVKAMHRPVVTDTESILSTLVTFWFY